MLRKLYALSAAAKQSYLVMALLAAPAAASAQPDSAEVVGATLRGWEENRWLAIYDRDGSYFGRASDRGILQRFNELMDFEYHIDVISYSPALIETRDWYRRENGARGWGGSLNHLMLLAEGHFKVSVPLGETWSTDARFIHQETLTAQRSLIWIRFNHDLFDRRGRAFFRSTLNSDKSQIDFELGFIWRAAPGEISVSFGALDLFSDLIYQKLEIGAGLAPMTLDYISRPYTGRFSVDMPLSRRLRLEAYALALTPSEVIFESQTAPDSGFVQEERHAYTGGLLEFKPTPATAVGAFGTWVRARLGRRPLPAGAAEDDFDLTEKSWSAGVYGVGRLSQRFALEAWIARVWRTEDRLRPDTTVAPQIEYEDRSWAGRATLTYRATSGFRADLGFDTLDRSIVKEDRVPGLGALRRDNSRLRIGFGWHFGSRALFLLGVNQDLDDSDGTGFDGAYGRFALYW
jgi:hypothetical protein